MRNVRRTRRRRPGNAIKSLVFFIALGVLMITTLIIPLHPTVSSMEGRELTKFPEFSVQSLFDGDFFSGIDSWFSDTMPGRDGFLTLNRIIQKLYGIQTVAVRGDVGQGDEIPDAPYTGE